MVTSRFYDYLDKLREPHYRQAIKVSWLHPDETVQKEFTNELYNINGNLTVNYQNGARRSCTITLSNDQNQFPIDYNNIWFGQKFQLWMGVYLNDGLPYYVSQGIFYVKNPKETYNPNTKTVTIQGVDKWSYLDGSLFGYLRGTYTSQINQDIRDLVKGLINKSRYDSDFSYTNNILDRVDPKDPKFINFENATALIPAYEKTTGNPVYKGTYGTNNDPIYFIRITNQQARKCEREDSDLMGRVEYTAIEGNTGLIDPKNIVSDYIQVSDEGSLFLNPYTMTTETGKTLADMILEYATVLFADVYYDEFGYLTFKARSRNVNDISDYNKEIIWNFTVTQRELLGLELTNSFDKLYNDIIVLGRIIGGKQMKARIQNQDVGSDSSIDKIGIKTKPPYESDQYYSNELCMSMAQYYAQTEMALDKTGSVKTLPIYHMDVNKIITLADVGNLKKEKFLVTGYTLPLNSIGQMSLNVTNLKYFTKWTDVTSTLEAPEEEEETNND